MPLNSKIFIAKFRCRIVTRKITHG